MPTIVSRPTYLVRNRSQIYRGRGWRPPPIGSRSRLTKQAAQRFANQRFDEIDGLAWEIARNQPATLAGVIAVLRYTADDPDNARWPDDGDGGDKWRSLLQKNLAESLERIARA
jgi:hypothetical protein